MAGSGWKLVRLGAGLALTAWGVGRMIRKRRADWIAWAVLPTGVSWVLQEMPALRPVLERFGIPAQPKQVRRGLRRLMGGRPRRGARSGQAMRMRGGSDPQSDRQRRIP